MTEKESYRISTINNDDSEIHHYKTSENNIIEYVDDYIVSKYDLVRDLEWTIGDGSLVIENYKGIVSPSQFNNALNRLLNNGINSVLDQNLDDKVTLEEYNALMRPDNTISNRFDLIRELPTNDQHLFVLKRLIFNTNRVNNDNRAKYNMSLLLGNIGLHILINGEKGVYHKTPDTGLNTQTTYKLFGADNQNIEKITNVDINVKELRIDNINGRSVFVKFKYEYATHIGTHNGIYIESNTIRVSEQISKYLNYNLQLSGSTVILSKNKPDKKTEEENNNYYISEVILV